MRRRPRLAMCGAILASFVVHALALLAFVEISRDRQAAMVVPMEQPEQPPIEVEILADPRAGTPGAEAEAGSITEQAAVPPTDPPPAQEAEAEQQASRTSPPEEAARPPEPPPPEPLPPASAAPAPAAPTRPANSAPVRAAAPLVRLRAGASAEGRPDGTTDIVLGPSTVPAGPDTSHYNIPPRFPPEAVRRGQQGVVRLNVLVGTDGTALSVDVAGSSGHPLLDRAAREAVARWRFQPGRDAGLAVPSTVPVTLSFVLEDRR